MCFFVIKQVLYMKTIKISIFSEKQKWDYCRKHIIFVWRQNYCFKVCHDFNLVSIFKPNHVENIQILLHWEEETVEIIGTSKGLYKKKYI